MAITAVRAECALNGRGFAISQTDASNFFYELKADGSSVSYGSLPGDRRPQIIPGEVELLILAGGLGYIFNLAASTLTRITDPDFPIGATKGGFLDSSFIVVEPNSQTFAWSDVNNGLSWDPLNFATATGEPGNVVSMLVDHRQLWFLCNNHTEIFVGTSNPDIPYQRLEGAYMEQGTDSLDGAFQCDNTIFWQGGNQQGRGIFWRANGYSPFRISNHAIEKLVQNWGDISDSSGYAYQENGHLFARWDFPNARGGLAATLLYDCSTGYWHTRYFWNATIGAYMGDLARCHMFVFARHLVGDWRSGNVYEQSQNYKTDAGAAIRRLRSSPDLANAGKWVFYGEHRLLMNVGIGLDGDTSASVIPVDGAPAGDGTNPKITVQLSNDGGETWGRERFIRMGKLGDFQRLVRWQQNGRSNNRALRMVCTEPVDCGLIALEMDVVAGT